MIAVPAPGSVDNLGRIRDFLPRRYSRTAATLDGLQRRLSHYRPELALPAGIYELCSQGPTPDAVVFL